VKHLTVYNWTVRRFRRIRREFSNVTNQTPLNFWRIGGVGFRVISDMGVCVQSWRRSKVNGLGTGC
jgi:hypothetical protein